ncbi:MAG: hypothetical protein IJ940_02780 [Bacteroidales bacterium]|nr:hypothetical protein [Bacteroidales bacterium]
MNIVKKTIELSDGRVIEIETGKLAKQADGSVVVKMGGTMYEIMLRMTDFPFRPSPTSTPIFSCRLSGNRR